MADIEKKKEEVPANPQTPPPTYVASDPEEDDLSDLDGPSHIQHLNRPHNISLTQMHRCPR
jgi:hypothetical protein